MSNVHLVTGATGFVGGALVLELLRQTDDRVVCLVRAGDDEAARERLHASLAEAARGYGQLDLLDEIPARVGALAGDILRPSCGRADGERVRQVWHCAASLKYEDDQAEEIFRHNVEGTRNVLDLARARGAASFNHVSTAYVAGRRTGVIREEMADAGAPCNNRYEESKVAGEHLVASAEGLHARILRPSIVIGHSRTLVATSFTGMYGFIRGLLSFKRAVARRLGDFLSHRSLRLLADPATVNNFIPVDAVAANAVAVGRSNSPARIFHLTNACTPTVGQGMYLLFRELGLRQPRYVASPRELTSIDEALDTEIKFYGSYLLNAKLFDRGNTDAVVGAAASHWPMTDEVLLAHLHWYLRTQTREGRGRAARGSLAVAS
jgi:thioester reductase-like protein